MNGDNMKKNRHNYLDTSPLSLDEYFNKSPIKTKGFSIQTIITCNECGSTNCEPCGVGYICNDCHQWWSPPFEVTI
jgi:hypothetical protein